MENKDYVLITERGVAAQKGMRAPEILATIFHAFLEIWNRDVHRISIDDARDGIVKYMRQFEVNEDDGDDIEALLRKLFGEEDGET